jgi:hypothetical protein
MTTLSVLCGMIKVWGMYNRLCDAFKKWWCRFNNHPGHRVFIGPFNGMWTLYCPQCDEYWDEIVDGVMPRLGNDNER